MSQQRTLLSKERKRRGRPTHANTLDKNYDTWQYSSELFWSKIDRKGRDECWTWRGSSSSTGPLFGIYRNIPGVPRYPQMTQARRVMWAEVNGSWPPEGQSIFHSCGNKHCLNDQHFSLTRPNLKTYSNYREQHNIVNPKLKRPRITHL